MKRLIICVALSLCTKNNLAQSAKLNIAPVIQKTSAWCWVGCGEMVFRFFGVCAINTDYQCGLIQLLGPQCSINCYSCPVTAQSTQRIINMFAQYPSIAHQTCGSSKMVINCVDVIGPISTQDIFVDIDLRRPILAGISPGGGNHGIEPAHATLIVGYENDENGVFIFINDPFPYPFNNSNPYIQSGAIMTLPGQYKIRYETFRDNFDWARTLKSIN